jgi:hypothetical protein
VDVKKESVEDTLDYISEITQVISNETNFISNVTDNVNKITGKIIIVFLLLIALSIIPFFIYTTQLIYDRVIYASIGVLTFISIFYSLLISNTGKDALDRINKSIETLKKYVEKVSDEEIKKRNIQKDIMGVGLIAILAIKSLEKLEDVKKFINVELYLRLTVFSLLISIVFSLFNVTELQLMAYALFVCGFSVSGVIILLWGSLPKILEVFDKHKNPRTEDGDISVQ